MTKPNKQIIASEVEKLNLQPGIINILFGQAGANPKVQTIFEPSTEGVTVSDEDGITILEQHRMSLPTKIVITKEENEKETQYTMSLAKK